MWRCALVLAFTGCGRLGFDVVQQGVDDANPGDGQPTDGMPPDGQTVRACQRNAAYVTSAGLASTYREGAQLVSWVDARAACMVDEADLWVVESETEQNAFTGDWTGITDVANEDVWVKLDGTVATFLPFGGTEPNGGTGENCIRTDPDGFEDRDCDDLRDFVCECPMP